MTDEIVQQVTDLIEGVIVMIVTSCVIRCWCSWRSCGWTRAAGDRYFRSRELSDGSFLSGPSKHAKKSGQSE
ncbi:MAG: hypothetical protein ACLS3M_00190 [Collinsella sp.]